MRLARSSTYLLVLGLAGCTGIAGQGGGGDSGPGPGGSDAGADAGGVDSGAIDAGAADAGMSVDGACGTANGVATTLEPASNLCAAGTATAVAGTGPWSWTCDGSGGGTNAACSAPVSGPIDGICGSATQDPTFTQPSMDLCDAGTATPVVQLDEGGAHWVWSCLGSDAGTNAACTDQMPFGVGVCGPANGVPTDTPPDGGLCDGGLTGLVQAMGPAGTPPFVWGCAGSGGGASAGCSAPAPVTGPAGVCGAANDVPVASAPAAGLCTTGTASAVGGTGPWSWTCTGVNGGATAYCFAPPVSAVSVGTLDAGPAGGGSGTMLLLTDGTVMVHDGNIAAAWYRLTPDSTGNYASGTWSSLPSMSFTRLFFASAVLADGRVLVGGGEYGTGTRTLELFDPTAASNPWTTDATWTSDLGDSTAEVMQDGTVLLLPRGDSNGVLYDATSQTWKSTSRKLGIPRPDNNDEESCVQLADGSFLVVDVNAGGGSQRYIPSSDQWVSAGPLPVMLVNPKFEIGAGLLLYDGRVFYLGGTGHTAFYDPASNAWTPGPEIPQGLVADDAPAAVMPNGHVLLAADVPYTTAPAHLFDFDPATLLFTEVAPSLAQSSTPMRMLVLPSGQVLINGLLIGIQVFTPNGSPQAAWQPSITSVSGSGATRTVTGVQLNGLNDGAYYGDDSQQATNYPLFRLVDMASGRVYYARSSGFSRMGVAPGASGSATMDVSGIPAGTYALYAVANGIASAATSLTLP